MQFITTDQRIAVENFEIGLIYTVTFTSGSYFLGACIGKGRDYVMFQRTAPELIFSLTMTSAADVASIDPLGSDIGKILEYTGSVPVSIKTDGSPLLAYTIKGNDLPGTGDKTANLMPAGELKTVEVDGITFGSDGKGKYSIRGTATAYASARFNLLQAFTTPISVSNGGQGTLSFFNTQSSNSVYFLFYNGATRIDDWAQTPIGRVSTAYNAVGNKYVDNIVIAVNSGTSVDMTISPEFTNDGVLPSEYEPFGVKIPILSGGTTTNIYLDNPLRKSLDGTAVDELSSNGKLTQRVDTDGSVLSTPIISYIDIPTIPTTDGLNIFDIDTTVKPSEVYIKYFSPLL